MANTTVQGSARVSDFPNLRAAFWPKKRKRQPKLKGLNTEKQLVRKYS